MVQRLDLTLVSLACALGLAGVFIGGHPNEAAADHTSCRQSDGNDSNNTIYGSDTACDEIWTYGGHDVAWGYAYGDYLHMGGGTDTAHGGNHGDNIYGGDNATTSEEVLKGGSGSDDIEDFAGPDWDLLCGGDDEDFLWSADGDTKDTHKGGSNVNQKEDKSDYVKDPDKWYPDGECT